MTTYKKMKEAKISIGKIEGERTIRTGKQIGDK